MWIDFLGAISYTPERAVFAMQAEPNKQSPQVPRTWRGVLVTVLMFALLYIGWWGYAAWSLRSVQAKFVSLGLPTTREQLLGKAPAENENASLLLREAAALSEGIPKDNLLFHCVAGALTGNSTRALTAKEQAELRESLSGSPAKEIVKLYTEAGRKSHCDFGRDYAKGFSVDISDAKFFLKGGRCLLSFAWFRANDGDSAGAIENIKSYLKICEFYMNEPTLISWLVGVSANAQARDTVAASIPGANFTDKEIASLSELFANNLKSATATALHMLDGERVLMGDPFFGDIDTNGISDAIERFAPTLKINSPGWVLRPLFIADHAAYLNRMLSLREFVVTGKPQGALKKEIPRWQIFTLLLTGSLDASSVKLNEYKMANELALLGLQAEKFRISNGRYPATLSDIPWEGAIPKDRFTGGELHYKVDGDSLLIYSVGSDLIDNGGNPLRVGLEKDIAWSVKRPIVVSKDKADSGSASVQQSNQVTLIVCLLAGHLKNAEIASHEKSP